jgi:uroporphyrin-III C-methyltransferase
LISPSDASLQKTTDLQAKSVGKVYLIGAGPGAADLITVRGAKLLAKADIVFYDALVDPSMLELCPQAKLVLVGKRCGKLSTAQTFISKRLVDASEQFGLVVRLKGGDPMIFGRADEEITTLRKHGVPFEIVPGITSALAAAASIEQSLTLRGVSRSVAFVTLAKAKEEGDELNSNHPTLSNLADTMVYYMGKKDTATIALGLMRAGKVADTPAVIVESISTPTERIFRTTLAELANDAALPWLSENAPAILVIGEALRTHSIDLFEGETHDGLQNQITFTDSARSA